MQKALPDDHPDLRAALNNMACCLFHLGQPEEAEQLYIKALNVMTQQGLGHEAPGTIKACGYLPGLLLGPDG